jgi:phosphoglycolate phosphatase-like HAD superfamily hydrolase
MHVVWDWNGTLLADLDLVVAATSIGLNASGGSHIGLAEYRAAFQRPLRAFYEQLLEAPLDDHGWTRTESAFHDHYHRGLPGCLLVAGAEKALSALKNAGLSQSLLSMWYHDQLTDLLQQRGLEHWFSRIDGDRQRDGGSKAGRLHDHLLAVNAPAHDTVLIGDTVDDAHAAQSVGAQVVLVAEHSSHTSESLAAAGPVVPDLAAAVKHILQLRTADGTYGTTGAASR